MRQRIEMPIRDVRRGFANALSLSETMIGDAKHFFPTPIRKLARSTADRLDQEQRAFDGLTLDDVRRASEILASGFEKGSESAFVSVFARGWDKLQTKFVTRCCFISETMVVLGLKSTETIHGNDPFERAALLCLNFRESNAIGAIPGFFVSSATENRDKVDLGIFAVLVWLLSSRSSSLVEEEKVLNLASIIVLAQRNEILSAFDNQTSLSEKFKQVSEHL
ncbi:MAG: hypothetical protein AAFX90_18310 [Pseudomonadota bacterium]